MKTLNTTLVVLFTILHAAFSGAQAQTVYDNNYDTMYFGGSGVNISNYPGTSNGTAQGDVVLYENVTILDGDTIDCYIITKSISSGVTMSNFDKAATAGATGSIIEDRFFAPQMTFPSGSPSGPGGEVEFVFQFIEHGSFSYNAGTNTPSGTPVILTNVRVNAYDIDGNANAYSNEYIQFKDFAFSELDENTTVFSNYDHATTYTTFYSPTHLKNSDATDDRFRVVVNYDTLSSLDIHILCGSTNYVFVDFGPGLPYTNNPISYYRVSGSLHNDGNGVTDNEINGPLIDSLDNNPVYMNLIENDTVIRSEIVQSGGYFSFAAVPQGNYTIQTSTSKTAINTGGVNPSLTTLWVNAGEFLGAGVGTDGTVNGILPITVEDTILINARFGVDKRPGSNDFNLSIADPLWGFMLPLGTNGTSILTGSDLEDGTKGAGDDMAITQLPSNGNEIYYNGSKIVYGQDGVNPPSPSNPFIITGYTTSLLQLRFVGMSSNSVSFKYATIDEAGFMDESPATYTLTWTTPVPVVLIGVTAERAGVNNLIKWSTATEYNTEKFVIERMVEGIEGFHIVGEVYAKGFSNDILNYQFVDPNAIELNADVAYRLRMVDFDGFVETSKWVSLGVDRTNHLLVYPNPASGSSVKVRLTNDLDNANAQIMDLTGKILKEATVSNGAADVDISDLPKGVYIMRVENGSTALNQRLYVY